jgi:hypothetical protein
MYCKYPRLWKVKRKAYSDKVKKNLTFERFVSIEEVQPESQQLLNTLTPADFNECFQKQQNRWYCCIQAKGNNFEDGGNVFMLLRANSRKFWEAPRI